MTPRQIAGSLYFARRRRQREAAERLALAHSLTRGEPRELKRHSTNCNAIEYRWSDQPYAIDAESAFASTGRTPE